MLPDPLHSRLPAIVRGAAVRVEVCPPDPRLSECHHTIGGHRLSPATGAHKNPSTKRKP